MGKNLYIFYNLEKHVLSLKGEPFMLNRDLDDVMEDAFSIQWDMVKTDLYCTGALLNPYLFYNKELVDNSNSLTICKRVLRELCSLEA
jgi:hypothetical protein